jgi:multidrug resistance efflux pump
MEPAIRVAIGALIISLLSFVAALTNSIFTVRTFRKNRRLEFLQRRDRLAQLISDLNVRNTEFQLISARYEIVALKRTGLRLQGEDAEQNRALIAAIKEQQKGVDEGIKRWDELIATQHLIYSHLTLETDAPAIEKMIANVQVASDNLKHANVGYAATLHILEGANEFLTTTLAEAEEKIRQINLDYERAVEKLTSQTEEKIRQI